MRRPRPAGRCRPAGAALVDGRDKLTERGERGQRIVIVVDHGYAYEAGSVIEPDGNVAEPVGLLFGELGEHGLDQLFVLVGGAGLATSCGPVDGGLAQLKLRLPPPPGAAQTTARWAICSFASR